MADPRKAAELAQDIKDSVLELSDGHRFPDLMEAIDQLAALSQPAEAKGEPLFLLHTGQIDSSGEQDEWETEADSWNRVEAFCRANPGKTIGLYPAAQKVQAQVPQGWRGMLEHVCAELEEVDDDTVQAQLPMLRAMLAAAPLPPAQPEHDTVLRITTAYEQGFGHAGRDLANPYKQGTQEHEAWDIGRDEGGRKQPQEPVNRRLLSTAKQALACMRGLQQHLGSAVCAAEASQLDAAIAEAEAQPVGREPLSRQTLIGLWGDKSDGPSNSEIVDFGRAVERAHGITGEGEK